MRCWAFPDPEREVFDQVVLMGYRKADPTPDATAEETVMRWSDGDLDRLGGIRYPFFTAPSTPSGDVLFATRTVDPVAAAAEARRSGLWASTEITDSLWPANDNRTRPLMPLQTGAHGDAGGGGLPRQPGASKATTGASWSRAVPAKEMVMVEETPSEKEVHREKLNTTVVALDLDDGQIADIAA